ncbi:MAG TPA: hypothetical protein VE566_04300 [Nitrososphaeraceae archaeon]|nr:hypothetical protein [Nitrososphaeraceae archaeon]
MLVGNSTAREEQAPLQVKTLFSKYRGVENPTITEYISSVPDTLSEAVDLMNSTWFNESFSATDYTLTNRKHLSEYIRRFHTAANTLTPAVNSAIGLLSDPSSKLLVSIHQPNLFAYGGVYKKIVLLETLKGLAESKKPNSKLVNLFLIVDHDFLDDIWMRTAQLPSIRNKGGVLEIRTPVSNTKRWQMVCNTPPPHKQILESWRKQLKLWIKNAATNNFDKSVLLRNFEGLWTDVEGAFIRSKSYSDFNAFFQSRVVNGIWGYKTLFVRLSDISPVFDKGFEFLLSGYDKYSRAVEKAEKYFLERNISTGVSSTAYLNAPVWIHCKCGSKASAKVREDKLGILVRGKCMSCKSDLQIDFENTKGLKLSKEVIHKVSPRAIPILLLLSKELGIGCYASGTGGSVGYTILGSLIFRELSIKMPLTVVWPADDMYVGLGQSEALEYLQLRQRSDVIDFLRTLRAEDFAMSREIRPMLEERNLLVSEGQPIDEILSKLFKLKERQRKIHSMIKVVEKVKNSLQIKPCFLDYGINFGVKNTEANWRNNLIKNNNLMLPLHLTSND